MYLNASLNRIRHSGVLVGDDDRFHSCAADTLGLLYVT